MNQYFQELANRLQSCEDTDNKVILQTVGIDLFEFIQANHTKDWSDRLHYGENLLSDDAYLAVEEDCVHAAKAVEKLCARSMDALPVETKKTINSQLQQIHDGTNKYETLEQVYAEIGEVNDVFPACVLRIARDRVLGQLSFVYQIGELVAQELEDSNFGDAIDTLRKSLNRLEQMLDMTPCKLSLESVELVNNVGASLHPGMSRIGLKGNRLIKMSSDSSAVKQAGIEVCYSLLRCSHKKDEIFDFQNGHVDLQEKKIVFRGIPRNFSKSVEYWKVVCACVEGSGRAEISALGKTSTEMYNYLNKMNSKWKSIGYRVFRQDHSHVFIDPQAHSPMREK